MGNSQSRTPKNINYLSGFRRLWFVSIFAWFLFAILFFDVEIDEWLDEGGAFNFFKVLLFLFWPVATYPIGFWIIKGFGLLSPPQRGDMHGRSWIAIGLRLLAAPSKGLKWLWAIGFIVWYGYVVTIYAFPISEWLGFHYSLLKNSGSVKQAMEQKQKMISVIEACRAAHDETCLIPTDRSDTLTLFPGVEILPNCQQTKEFNDAFMRQARARGIRIEPAGKKGEACLEVYIPENVRWAKFIGIILAPIGLITIGGLIIKKTMSWLYHGRDT